MLLNVIAQISMHREATRTVFMQRYGFPLMFVTRNSSAIVTAHQLAGLSLCAVGGH
jgi:hypothetical protein